MYHRLLPTLVMTLLGCVGLDGSMDQTASEPSVPRYTEGGALLRPKAINTWTFVGASVGLAYKAQAHRKGPGLIHSVQMQPAAFAEYEKTGEFRLAESNASLWTRL